MVNPDPHPTIIFLSLKIQNLPSNTHTHNLYFRHPVVQFTTIITISFHLHNFYFLLVSYFPPIMCLVSYDHLQVAHKKV